MRQKCIHGQTIILFLLLLISSSIEAQEKSIKDYQKSDYPFDERTSFTPIYNRQNLSGWTMQGRGLWNVDQGDFVGRQDPSEKEDSWLFTSAEWTDFALELEFNLPENGNSGIGIRMPKDSIGSPDVNGYEVQISDLPKRKLTGSLLHHVESKGNNQYHPNQWNRLAIICEGERIRVYLNKEKIQDEKVKGSAKGRIGLQIPKDVEFSKQVVRFRNLRVKDLNRQHETRIKISAKQKLS